MNVLHIVSHLNYSGSNNELAAVSGDQRRGGQVRVCCLGPRGPWADRLEAAGVSVIALDWTRCFDVAAPLRLRDLLLDKTADAVQVWGSAALRWAVLLAPSRLSQVILCPPFARVWHPFDRWLLGRVRRVVVRDEVEKSRMAAAGAAASTIVVIPPGVACCASPSAAPSIGPRIVGIGPIEAHKNFRDAIWSMDILANIFDDLDLELVGQGTQRDYLSELATHFQKTKLRLAGEPDDIGPHFASAELCWLPGTDGCRHAALEAMAAGRPIVASNLPHLRELIPDGEAGFLVPPGDKIALARKTRTLLLDPDLRERMGEAGRRHVLRHYPQDAFVQRWRQVYSTRSA